MKLNEAMILWNSRLSDDVEVIVVPWLKHNRRITDNYNCSAGACEVEVQGLVDPTNIQLWLYGLFVRLVTDHELDPKKVDNAFADSIEEWSL